MGLSRTYYRRDWVMASGLPLMGLISGSRGDLNDAFSVVGVLFIITALFMLCYARVVNDYYDAIIEGEKNALTEERDVSKKSTLLIVKIPLLLSLVLLVPAGLSTASTAFSVAFLLTVWAYAAPPLRIRNWRTGGTIGNIAWAVCIFSAGYFIKGSAGINYAIMANAVGFAFLVNELVHQMDHAEKDKRLGHTTVANLLGIEKTKKLIYISFAYHATFNIIVLLISHEAEQLILVAVTVAANLMRLSVIRKINRETVFKNIRSRMYNKAEVTAYCLYWVVISYL